jgi:hypothetical protein
VFSVLFSKSYYKAIKKRHGIHKISKVKAIIIAYYTIFDYLPYFTFHHMTCSEAKGQQTFDLMEYYLIQLKKFHNKYSWSDEEIDKYEQEMMELSDKATLELTAKLARESGLEDGKAEGIEIGLAKGVEKGAKEASINIAKGMLEASISVDQIIKITGLTKEEIEDIR